MESQERKAVVVGLTLCSFWKAYLSVTRSTSAPERSASILCPIDSSLLCGSSSLRMIDPNKQLSTSYTASTHSVRSIMMQPGSSNKDLRFLTAAEFDRFINIYEEDNQYLIGCLTTESEVRRMDLWTSAAHTTSEPNGKGVSNHTSAQETLVALNNDGILELYERPFDFESASSENPSHTAKEKAKQRSRKAFARVRIVRPTGDSATVPLIDVSFDENDIIVAWAEGGVNVVFDRIRWRSEDNGQILLKGPIDIAKSKGSAGIGGAVMNGVKDVGQTQMDDSRAVVTNGVDSDEHSETESRTRKETIEISSAEEESEFEEDEGEDLAAAAEADARALINDKGNGNAEDEDEEGDEDEEMVDASPTSAYQQTKEILPDGEHEGDKEDDADNEDDASPSFGDLLRAQHPSALSAIPVSTSTNATVSHSLVPTTGNIAVSTDPSVQTHATSALSLTTLLTQSLRTSDTTLLESCLHHPSLPDIRHTIERLPPHFAPPLLARLAERLHSRPGRAGSLMVWIQWTLVAHGGYLASAGGTSTGMSAGAGIGSKEVIQQLRSLHKVVRERARGLGELLQLKGKLDMLDAQMRLRQAVMSQGRNKRKRGSRNEGEDEDEDEDVDEEDDERIVYVEGQEEEEEDDDEDEDEDAASESGSESGSGSGSISDDVDDDEELPNGIAALEEEVDLDAEDDEDDEDKANLLDMEASESEGEASDGDGAMADQDIDHDDVDTESSSSDPGSGTGSGSGSVVDVNTDVDMDEAETEEEGEEEKKRWKKKQRRT